MQTAPKKVLNGWAMYDWANSVYNLVITTTFFPVYYTEMTKAAPFNGQVTFLGRTFVNTALYSYALAFTYLLVAFSLPILSSIADYRGNKKSFMQFFCTIGAIACSSLYFFSPEYFSIGIICMMVAAFGFYASLVFYNSYLPEIAAEKDRDRISARGFTFGYIGSVLMQIIGFALVMFWDSIPFLTGEGHAIRFTFLLVGIWWLGFAQIPFRRLPKGTPAVANPGKKNSITGGYNELKKVFRLLMSMPVVKRFLIAFFFYNMGVQTVMLAATNFGSKVLNLPSQKLIITIVLIQLVAIAGAHLMAKLSGLYGNFKVLIGVVTFWIGVCIAGYLMRTEYQFYALACAVGLVMGGIQALSRSTYSKLMPPTKDTASFFSFYDVTEKIAIVIGLTAFGYIEEFTGDMRNSVLSLMVFFALGLIWLIAAYVKQKKYQLESYNYNFMKLYAIETGNFKLDGGAMFGVVPKSMWNKLNPADENNMCSWAMRCLLIEEGNKLILVDNGMGNKQDAKFFGHYFLHGDHNLDNSLAGYGFNKDDITDVFLTHLHFDHCGGSIEKSGEKLVPAFKNAKYWSNEKHWGWAVNPNDREKASFLKENILPIKESGQLHMITVEDGVSFSENISIRFMNGHTESMMLPQIRYKDKTIVFMADLLPSIAHIPIPFVMAYETRPLETLAEKKRFMTEALENDFILFFEHDHLYECCNLQMTEKGVRAKEIFKLEEMV